MVSFAASSALVAVGLLFWLEAETWLVQLVGVLGLLDVVLIAQFFRIPKRVPVADEGQILCPSDGKVVVIEEVEEPEVLGDKRIQVSIFMSPLNVHAQWAPMAGEVTHANYHPGKYLVAWHPKSSIENERTTLVINGVRNFEARRKLLALKKFPSLAEVVDVCRAEEAAAKTSDESKISVGQAYLQL